MSKEIEVGSIVTGKVTGIQPYGAFVSISDELQGLVHISEVTHGFVKDVNEYVTLGQEVSVKILSIDEASGKIGLSMKATEEAPVQEAPKAKSRNRQQAFIEKIDSEDGFNTLKDKLQEWIDQSQKND